MMFPGPWKQESSDLEPQFRAEPRSVLTYSQRFDQLRVSGVTADSGKEKLRGQTLRAAPVCGYECEHLEVQFSKQ